MREFTEQQWSEKCNALSGLTLRYFHQEFRGCNKCYSRIFPA